ncbi:hypothetical protein RNZ50_24290 [Paracoccaceae bacterium Fryx2]|nr:hypothetical protein [Paracoccaceae bacterium Fryx2]
MRHVLGLLWLCIGLGAAPVVAGETYDLLFRQGALDGVAAVGGGLTYDQETSVPAAGAGPQDTVLDLRFAPGDSVVATLRQGERSRGVGTFPASVGNPVIMYFMETALRDMAQQTAGSPFYIRNRMKDSLLHEALIEAVSVPFGTQEVAARRITLKPFAQDAARDRMGQFADLALTVTVSDEVPGWYLSLVATAPALPGSGAPAYSSALTLMTAAEAAQ